MGCLSAEKIVVYVVLFEIHGDVDDKAPGL